MSYLGAAGIRRNQDACQARQSTCAYFCAFGDRSLSLWGQPPGAIVDGQGILLHGRLFRSDELAAELQIGPSCDSTLLLHAHRKWGPEFPEHVQGEYAFVLWDVATGRLLLGRDPSGCWPLYYAHRGHELIFSNRIHPILKWPGISASLNEQHIAHWLALIPAYSPKTFFEGVFSIQPGTTLLFEDSRVSINDFWHPETTPMLRLRDSREYVEGLLDVLDRAISDRLLLGSAVASQLSGGLDSSTVTATAARQLNAEGRRLFAFTAVPARSVDVPGRFTDEGPHASAVAAMYPNIDHILVPHGVHDVFSLIDLFNSMQGEPIFNPGNYDWIYEICLQAGQRGSKTVLVGFSGNFTFSYDGTRALRSLACRSRLLDLARLARNQHCFGNRRWLSIASELMRPWIPVWLRRALDRMRGQLTATHDYAMIQRGFSHQHELSPMALEEAHLHLNSRELRLMFLRRPDFGPAFFALRHLTGVGLTDPTGDRRLIEYCLSVPVEYYCENGVPRSLIRNAMIGRLPEMVRTERRKGLQAADFSIHFEAEQQEALAEVERLKQVDLAARALDLQAMEAMLRMSQAEIAVRGGMSGFWPKLLRALSLGRFIRRYEDGTLFSVPETPAEPSLSL